MRRNESGSGAVAIVGVGAILPDAPDASSFWQNLREGRYSISEVTDRWDEALYYDPDPAAPDRTYSKIGGWCREYEWNPLGWRMPIPPKVGDTMDPAQKWAVACAREALADCQGASRPLDRDRTAVIMGNALGGDFHLLSAARILFPEMGEELKAAPSFRALPAEVRSAVFEELVAGVRSRIPNITEDTMPGELGNIVAGRVAALFDLHGPNYIADAACASAMAAMSAAVEGLRQGEFDAAITGGIDANMSASTFVKFAKIGALSATGTRPYGEGADGFVMGEGAAVFVLKRLEDAERDGDRIYAVVLGIGGSSDGKGKGITAPNPVGQKFALERAWARAGVAPEPGDMVEGHGTSTAVGDVVEVQTLTEVFQGWDLPVGSVALGSVKSNIGHLKGAAGAAGVLKAALALHHREIPPSINVRAPNPRIDFANSPFAVNHEHRAWDKPGNGAAIRRAGVSAFGFGGTNFHLVMEEYVPGRHGRERARAPGAEFESPPPAATGTTPAPPRAPLRGALVIGDVDEAAIARRLREVKARADRGEAPEPTPPQESDLRAPVRLAIDYGSSAQLAELAGEALVALTEMDEGRWRILRNRGVYLGRGKPGKVAFLFPGQGSQYVNMIKELRDAEPVVERTFREADRVMTPILGGPLTGKIFLDSDDEGEWEAAEERLKQTEITQPAVLTVDTAISRLLKAWGIEPDMVMGHSLGEYAALVEAGGIPFEHALQAVAARGEAMRAVSTEDNGRLAAVFAPVAEVEPVLEAVDGYVVVANMNSTKECVIGGASDAVEAAMKDLEAAEIRTALLPVSHAFHTRIVEGATEPLRQTLRTLDLRSPRLPVVANVTASFYPVGSDAPEKMVDLLGRQIGSAVRFVEGLETLYEAGARVFVEVGPKRALYGMADDVLGDREGVTVHFANHPRDGGVVTANRALCGLYAEGLGTGLPDPAGSGIAEAGGATPGDGGEVRAPEVAARAASPARSATSGGEDRYLTLGRMFAEFLDRSFETYAGGSRGGAEPVRIGITGASLGLPGEGRVFEDDHVVRILRGDGFITSMPEELARSQLDRRITRLVKGPNGQARFETIDDPAAVIKLAGRGGALDLSGEFGFPEDRLAALDRVTRLAIAAGIEALRDAGIPLVMRYKSTTTGSKLPAGWGLPEEMRDDTGVVFGSAFPGYDQLVRTLDAYHEDRTRRARLAEVERLRASVSGEAAVELERRASELRAEIEDEPFAFDRRFLFQVLAMGHSQFAEYIGARGPNTQVNGACASGMHALITARDWIETGRCRRVVVITADDITTDAMFPWWASGFLASGAAATDARVEDAALPFDRRRHGLIMGMGGAGLVLEDVAVAAERGLVPICEVMGTVVANSAFHGSRLDMNHITDVMEGLVAQVESRWGVSRSELAREMVFVSHETYTPARGGSAGAEVQALREVFGADADAVVVANTKGFTGHPMGVGIEESLSVKMLETGVIPPVANYREVDPELGTLNLSRGGSYPVRYALRLGAGFGSQIAMGLFRWTPPPDGARREPGDLGFHHRVADSDAWSSWLARVTGYDAPELEVMHRTLRVKDQGPPALQPRPRRATRTGVAPAAAGREESDVGPARAEAPGVRPVAPGPQRPWPAAPTVPAGVPSTASAPGPVPATPGQESAHPAPAPSREAADPVEERVIAIITEQTGYPPDMLELDLDLEADLGIDTVKQAEMFAAIRGEYGIERDENLALRDYPTLAHAIQFVYEKRPDLRHAGHADPVAPAPPEASASAAVASAPAPQPPAPGDVTDAVAEKVIAIIAEQTGYPPDMLELDLDLEADLGIDTVKQAEMFAAIRGEYGIERDENLALRDYPTLAHAIQFVYEKRPDLRHAGHADPDAPLAPAPPEASPAVPATESSPHAPTRGSMEAAQAIPRRIPVPRLRPPLDRFPATGIDLGRDSRVVVVADGGGVADALSARLRERGVEVLRVEGASTATDLEATVAEFAGSGGVTGLYWLPALDGVPEATLRDADQRREALQHRVKNLHAVARILGPDLGGPGTFFLSGSRLGGFHGYDAGGATDILGGAVAGYTKAFARERPEALTKALDLPESADAATVAEVLLAETLRDPGAVEIGYGDGRRWSIGLEERRVEPGESLPDDLVYVVSGAAGSIVSAIVADLARARGGTFWLLDLAPEPDPDNPDLARLTTDPEGLKRELFERLRTGRDRVTPVQVEAEFSRLEREASAASAMRAVEAAGGRVHYRSLDLRDADAVSSTVEEILAADGRVDVLIHAAGLEISRTIPQKSQEEFDRVFDVKADGWFNLLAAIGEAPLGAVVTFSSIAGRFGNAGQVDYSAANDLLCKAVSAMRRARPDTVAVSLDWTAWRDIGMAARGSIPSIMAAAGIDMLAPEAGIPVVRRELAAGTRGEVLVAGALGRMVEEDPGRTSLDSAFLAATTPTDSPVVGSVRGIGLSDGLVVETVLNPTEQPFLDDHRIDGTPVLPGVMGLEAMAQAARAPFPDHHVTALEEVHFHSPFKFYRDEPRTLRVQVHYQPDGPDLLAECRLIGSRQLVGRESPESTVHFTGRVRLSRERRDRVSQVEIPEPSDASIEAPTIYRTYFHGPAYRVLDRVWRVGPTVVGRLAEALPPNHVPEERETLVAPRLVELGFQAAGVAEIADSERMGLPRSFDQLEIFDTPSEGGALALVTERGEGVFDIRVTSLHGDVLLVIQGYRTSALPTPLDADPFAALRG